jgi:hypothetical protein
LPIMGTILEKIKNIEFEVRQDARQQRGLPLQ